MGFAYNYMLSNKGIELAETYPYQGSDTFECRYNVSNSVGSPTTYVFAEIGTVAVGIDASQESFFSFASGVMNYYAPVFL